MQLLAAFHSALAECISITIHVVCLLRLLFVRFYYYLSVLSSSSNGFEQPYVSAWSNDWVAAHCTVLGRSCLATSNKWLSKAVARFKLEASKLNYRKDGL